MFPLFNFRALFGAVVGAIIVVAGLFVPVRGYWSATPAGFAGTSTTVQAVVAPAVVLTGFQAAPAVRRGPEQLRLAAGARLDLDSRRADWAATDCAERCDLLLDGSQGVEEAGGGELADKSAAYYSCLAASEYGFTITPELADAGVETCVRTGDGRHAALTVTGVEKAGGRISLIAGTITVWEAPPVTVLRSDEEEPPLFQELPPGS
ncbi:hypothetical protein Aph02nite_32490 [Actinoplanes philippinensis]|uniref:Uncharacterized protein n=1 Tax=Actinoplanes philippinensis TaxID=35752 RepID=A0A1I2E2X2_9ACTN|nr:hypothetical protein [Actinoplanes philippinensis]GIE77299.1 hypothetical protein Aph02nite_32490 [Actinoplanes philippinensis]SFE87234.1 hypothetical protein SAMN05421541_104155 [Actinoplanes philippinensis]